MKLLTPRRTSLLFTSYSPSSSSLQFFTHHTSFLRLFHFSSSLPQHSFPSHSSRRHDDESRNVKVSVWWDFENCNLPAGANVFKVACSITAAIRVNGIKGPIQITAFGDVLQLSRSNLTHIPHGGKNSADRSLLVDLLYWVSQNPPPAHIFLISGDRDFASILHRLRMNNYNVLLASMDSAPSVLCSAASIMWHWYALARGDNVTGKYFNQPPDGPYNSWYGHYKVPLEDPYSVPEQSASPRVEESAEPGSDSNLRSISKECSEPGSNLKLRPVPKAVMKQIHHILSSCPKGMGIAELRMELGKGNINLDKNLYGYRKFSRFLLSMPHILKLRFGSDGKYFVHGLIPRAPEPQISTLDKGPVSNKGMCDSPVTLKLNGQSSCIIRTVDGNSESPSQAHELSVAGPPTKFHKPSPLNKEVGDVTNALAPEVHPPPMEEQDSAFEVGFSGKFWKKWFVHNDNNSEKAHNVLVKSSASVDSSKSEEKYEESASPSNPLPSAHDESFKDNKSIRSSEEPGDKSSASAGLFNKMINWCKFWSSSTVSETSSGYSDKQSKDINSYPIKNELFSKESFWVDMEVFLDTPEGAGTVSQSRNREQMAQALLKEGPPVLKSLKESDILHLVELLIVEKKWLEECSSQTSPFKLARPVRRSSICAHVSSGLTSSFLGKKRQDLLHHSAPSVVGKKHLKRSRNEILSDCQRLITDILKEQTGGFNLGAFRKLFYDRYGYMLDNRMLGYPKLASLLHIMPGVRIEWSCVFPEINSPNSSFLENSSPGILENSAIGKTTNCESESSPQVSRKKDDDLKSCWEELGPIENSSSDRTEKVSRLSCKVKEETVGHNQSDYEYSLSDDDYISDSEEEGSPSTVSRDRGKPKINGDNSLLLTLDSWYSSKEDNSRKDCTENVNSMADCSKNDSETSGSLSVDLKTETTVMGHGQEVQKPSSSHSFVSDQAGDNRNKLIDAILGSLKKAR